jgi:glycosyltransferase involved in cell wall biosynthesis
MNATFHVLGLAHQPVTTRVPHCAYTMKVLNMCRMLKAAGQKVVLYHAGSETAPDIADQYEQCVPDVRLEEVYGERYYERFNQQWKENDFAWAHFKRTAARRLSGNLGDTNHIVLASFGNIHKPSCPAHEAALTIELGVGYEGVFARNKVFESYAWQHFIYGRQPWWVEGKEFDTVIPNYIDPAMFVFSAKKQDYALFLGRVVREKGVLDAMRACKEVGMKIVICGDGDYEMLKEVDEYPDTGNAGVDNRRVLLAQAKVLIAPTQYIEPFGGVAVEAAYSGTPVIATDYGGFTETVVNGRTGFRVRDLAQMVTALKRIDEIDPEVCHQWGKNFTLDAIWPRYFDYFSHQLARYNRE